jgi:hypothetical protein
MAKFVHDDVLDAALSYIRNNCTRMVACSAQPTNFTEANATLALADVTMAPADFTIGNGSVSGRKVTVAAKTGVTVDASGTINHLALLDVTNSKLLFVTTTGAKAVTAGGNLDIGSWDDEIADPV